jgi:hypothetical protein
MTRSMYRLTEVNVRPLTDSPEHSPLVVGLELPTAPEGRMGGPHLAPERKDGGEALALDGEGAGELRCYSGSKAKHGWFWFGARLRLVPYVSVGRGRWAGLCYSWAGSTRGRRREESPLSLSRLSRGDPAVARRTLGAMGNASGRMDEGFPRGSPPGSPPPMFVPQVRDSLFHILYINCNAHSSSNCL